MPWPDALPRYPILGTTQTGAPRNAVASTNMDVGPPKVRRRTSAAIRSLEMTFAPVTEDGVAEFEEWFDDDIGMGALAFEIEHPVTGAEIQVQFADASPYQVRERTVDDYSIAVRLWILP